MIPSKAFGAIFRITVALAAGLAISETGVGQTPAGTSTNQSQPRPAPIQRSTDRRSQRVRMEQVQVTSPDGKVRFVVLPNAERLSFTILMGELTVIEASPLKMIVDGFDLASGIIFTKVTRDEINETYPWEGAHRTATNHCHGAKIMLVHDLSMTAFLLEIRAFNDGAAYRLIVPGTNTIQRTPDEYSEFVLPASSTVWFHDLDGHYEAAYEQKEISEVKAGQWAGPPLTFALPRSQSYASITEANLVNYSGMALEADGRRGWIVGLGHRQPVNYPFELRYGREEARRSQQCGMKPSCFPCPGSASFPSLPAARVICGCCR